MIGLKKEKKKKTNVEKKETHVDNRGFGFWIEISTNYFFYCIWQIKHLYFFWKKSKMQPVSSNLRNDKFLLSLLNLVWF